MSRFKSPQTAAKHAERAAKDAGQRRREKRNSLLMIIGLALVSLSLIVADFFWLKARAEKRREEHLQRRHQRTQTNSPAAPVSIPGQQNTGAQTNLPASGVLPPGRQTNQLNNPAQQNQRQ